MTGELTLFRKAKDFADRANQALVAASSVEAVKAVRDWSHAARAFAEQTKDRSLMADAWEFIYRAERKLGGLIIAQKETVGLNEGGRPPKTPSKKTGVSKIALAEAGINYKLSSRAQALFRTPIKEFERIVAELKAEILAATIKAQTAFERARARAVNRGGYESRIIDGCTLEDLDRLAASGYRAGAIAADPPWSFEVYSGKGKQRSADRYYNTMSLDWLCDEFAPRVRALAADDCAFNLWSVCPEQPGALRLIEACGFEYKTVGFVWVKTNPSGEGLFTGMGYWTRANIEPVLFATKGTPERIAKDVHQVIMVPVSKHSEKPDEVYSRIERLVGGPYLELFGRELRPGWTVWGNEIPRTELIKAAE